MVDERNDFAGDKKRLDDLRKERKRVEAEAKAEEEAIAEQKRLQTEIKKEKHRLKDAEKRKMSASSYNSFYNKTKRGIATLQKEAKHISKEMHAKERRASRARPRKRVHHVKKRVHHAKKRKHASHKKRTKHRTHRRRRTEHLFSTI